MLLTKEQLNSIIEDFKLTNLDSIKNRHKMLSIDAISELIETYNNKEINVYDDSLKQEIKALSKILLKNDIEEYKIQFLGTRDRKFLPLIMFTRF